MTQTTNKAKVARYSAGRCARCGESVEQGTLIEPIQGSSVSHKRWVHVGCSFPEGMTLHPNGCEWIPISETSGESLFEVDSDDVIQAMLAKDVVEAQEQVRGIVRKIVLDEIERTQPTTTAKLKGEIYSEMSDIMAVHVTDSMSTGLEGLAAHVTEMINAEIKRIPSKVIEIHYPDGTLTELDGEVQHERMDDVIDLCTSTPREPVFLTGPTGSGKTFLCQQLSRILDVRFGMVSCSAMMSESQLLGRAIPNLTTGEVSYQSTEFVEIFENGGIWLFDEVDAADSNTLLVLNSALANGVLAIPNRIGNPYAAMHQDFMCICAANTFGTGGDRQYVGRTQLDMAFLDRFRVGIIEMDYSEAIERVKCPDMELYDTLVSWRRLINQNNLRRVMSTRFMEKAYKMKTQKGWTMSRIKNAFFTGWTEDEKVMVLGC
jgi:cobaltochelatase CobS